MLWYNIFQKQKIKLRIFSSYSWPLSSGKSWPWLRNACTTTNSSTPHFSRLFVSIAHMELNANHALMTGSKRDREARIGSFGRCFTTWIFLVPPELHVSSSNTHRKSTAPKRGRQRLCTLYGSFDRHDNGTVLKASRSYRLSFVDNFNMPAYIEA